MGSYLALSCLVLALAMPLEARLSPLRLGYTNLRGV
jgi:hypothetical protein